MRNDEICDATSVLEQTIQNTLSYSSSTSTISKGHAKLACCYHKFGPFENPTSLFKSQFLTACQIRREGCGTECAVVNQLRD